MEAFRFSPRPNRAHDIRWREWGPEAFQEAQRLDRPILLSLSAVWCHWCHVMDESSYSDPRVIELLNRDYLPIRVDNDRHPEVNQRYNMGGWPTTAFLTPQGDILTGATYVPPDALHSMASQVLQFYRTRKAELYSRILEQRGTASMAGAPSELPQDAADRVLDHLERTYDTEFGGFGTEPKFPQGDSLELILERYHSTGEERWAQMAAVTLKAMGSGGMFDHVAGGFFRYSTSRDWSVPHYEKMAEDNAALLRAFLHGAQVLVDPELARVAGRTADYILSTLYDGATGGIFGSQDADEEYYRMAAEERARHEPPLVDRTVYTNWAAAMASALLEASRVLRRPELEEAALGTLGFLWEALYREGQGMYHYYDGEARGPGLLGDQAWTLAALLDAYEATGSRVYVQRAGILADLVCARFADAAGGFFDTWEGYEPLGRLQVRDKGILENCVAAGGLMRLYHMTGAETYRGAAQGALRAFASDYLRYGPYAAAYARAMEWTLNDPLQLRIVGQGEATLPWREAALSSYHPYRIVQTLDPAGDRARLEDLGLPVRGAPVAYVCRQGACASPVEKAEDVAGALEVLGAPHVRKS